MGNPRAAACTAEHANSSLKDWDPLHIIVLFFLFPSRELPALFPFIDWFQKRAHMNIYCMIYHMHGGALMLLE